MRKAIYVRASSKSQDTRSQESALTTRAKAHGEEAAWYKDQFSGTSMARPGLEQLLADVRSGLVTKVVVWRSDRLGRTAKGLLVLLDELQVLGVGLVSLREGFDLSTPAGRLMAGVLASVASYETEVRKERQLAGIARAKAEGKQWGGRKPGTRVKLTVEKENLIQQLHREGKPVAAIARLVGLTRKTAYKAFQMQDNARSSTTWPPRASERTKARRYQVRLRSFARNGSTASRSAKIVRSLARLLAWAAWLCEPFVRSLAGSHQNCLDQACYKIWARETRSKKPWRKVVRGACAAGCRSVCLP